jgi:hypothetical protein
MALHGKGHEVETRLPSPHPAQGSPARFGPARPGSHGTTAHCCVLSRTMRSHHPGRPPPPRRLSWPPPSWGRRRQQPGQRPTTRHRPRAQSRSLTCLRKATGSRHTTHIDKGTNKRGNEGPTQTHNSLNDNETGRKCDHTIDHTPQKVFARANTQTSKERKAKENLI